MPTATVPGSPLRDCFGCVSAVSAPSHGLGSPLSAVSRCAPSALCRRPGLASPTRCQGSDRLCAESVRGGAPEPGPPTGALADALVHLHLAASALQPEVLFCLAGPAGSAGTGRTTKSEQAEPVRGRGRCRDSQEHAAQPLPQPMGPQGSHPQAAGGWARLGLGSSGWGQRAGICRAFQRIATSLLKKPATTALAPQAWLGNTATAGLRCPLRAWIRQQAGCSAVP
jgi:hypothetical protein